MKKLLIIVSGLVIGASCQAAWGPFPGQGNVPTDDNLHNATQTGVPPRQESPLRCPPNLNLEESYKQYQQMQEEAGIPAFLNSLRKQQPPVDQYGLEEKSLDKNDYKRSQGDQAGTNKFVSVGLAAAAAGFAAVTWFTRSGK